MDETRAAIRESAIRVERALQAFAARSAKLQREFDESRTQTQAIWALLDCWCYGPPPDPA